MTVPLNCPHSKKINQIFRIGQQLYADSEARWSSEESPGLPRNRKMKGNLKFRSCIPYDSEIWTTKFCKGCWMMDEYHAHHERRDQPPWWEKSWKSW